MDPIHPSRQSASHGMFSAAGNRRVATLIRRATKACETRSRAKVLEGLAQGMRRIAERYPEVHDTAVRESIASSLDPAFEQAGFHRLSIYEI